MKGHLETHEAKILINIPLSAVYISQDLKIYV